MGGGRQEPLGHVHTGASLPPLYIAASAPQPPPTTVSGNQGGWQGLESCSRPTHLSVLRPKLRPLPALGEEDEDVAHERERVVQGATQGDVLVLRDLTKVGVGWGASTAGLGSLHWPTHLSHRLPSSQVYPGQRTPAVDRLCLGIPPGEVSPGDARVRGCPIVRPLVFTMFVPTSPYRTPTLCLLSYTEYLLAVSI